MSETAAPAAENQTPPPPPTEGEPTGERRLLNPEMAGAQAVVLLGGTLPGGKLDTAKIEKIGNGEEQPNTEKATKASFNERDEHWRDVEGDHRMTRWKESTNTFFMHKKEGESAEKDFLKQIGIDLEADDIAQKVYDKFFATTGAKGDLGVIADAIHQATTPEFVETHKELILQLGNLYGKNSSEILLLLVQARKNAQAETVGQFLQQAQSQIQVENQQDMKGFQLLQAMHLNSTAWDTKVAARKQTASQQTSESADDEPDENEANNSVLTPELARTNPELFQQKLLEYLEQKSPKAKKLWDYVIRRGGTSSKIIFDATRWSASLNMGEDHAIRIGTQPIPPEKKRHILYDDRKFTYPNQLAYKLTHELSHALYEYINRDTNGQDRNFLDLLDIARVLRERHPDTPRGLTSLASFDTYQEGYDKRREDITELIASYLWKPEQLQGHLKFLATQPDEELARLGMAKIDNPNVIYDKISAMVDLFFSRIDTQ